PAPCAPADRCRQVGRSPAPVARNQHGCGNPAGRRRRALRAWPPRRGPDRVPAGTYPPRRRRATAAAGRIEAGRSRRHSPQARGEDLMKQVSNTRAPHLASRRAVLLAAVVACALASGGCSSVKNLFTSKKAKALKPTELVEFAPSVSVTRLWSAEAGKGEGLLGARQGPTVADGRVYAAAVRGGGRAVVLNGGALVGRDEAAVPVSGGRGEGG